MHKYAKGDRIMIKFEAMNKMCLDAIMGKKLTTKQLNSYGLDANDLRKLTNKGYLDSVRYGLYSFKFGDISSGIISIVIKGDYKEGMDSFERLHEQNPKDLFIAYNLFISCILCGNYNRAFDMFERLYRVKGEREHKNLNYYLFLLDEITPIPEEYRYILKESFEIGAIYVPHDSANASEVNKIRNDISIRRFDTASEQLEEQLNHKEVISMEDLLESILIKRATKRSYERRKILSNYSATDNTIGTDSLLSERMGAHTLNLIEEYVLKMRNRYEEIRTSKEVPEIINTESKDVFAAIDNNDFFGALKLSDKKNELRFWVSKVCGIIITTLFEKCPAGKVGQDTLDRFLEISGKKHYRSLICQTIKIGLQEKSMETVIDMITNLGMDCYSFDLEKYEKCFEDAIKDKKTFLARMYLNILGKATKYGKKCEKVEAYSTMLNTLEQTDEEQTYVDHECSLLLRNKGALLIELSQESNIHEIINRIRKQDNIGITRISSENIKPEEKVKFVLRYQAEVWSSGKLRNADRKVVEKYGTGDFIRGEARCVDTCICYDLQLLEHSSEPNPISYKRLGDAYYRIGKHELAYNYLRIYKEITKAKDPIVDTLLSVYEWSKKRQEQERLNKNNGGIDPNTRFRWLRLI